MNSTEENNYSPHLIVVPRYKSFLIFSDIASSGLEAKVST